MTAVTTDLNTPRRIGDTRSFDVGAAAQLFAGTLVNFDTATDVLVDGTDAANRSFAGIAAEARDNSSGAAGDLVAEIYDSGEFLLAHSGGPTAADIGKRVYLKDNATVDWLANVTNPIYVGCVVGMGENAGDVWVKIEPDAPTPAQARADRLYCVEVPGVNATAFDLSSAAAEYGGDDFVVSEVISVQSFVTATGGSDGLKVVTTDWTLAAGAISAVGDETLNTWVMYFLGTLQSS